MPFQWLIYLKTRFKLKFEIEMLVFIITLTSILMPHSLDCSKGLFLRTVPSLFLWCSAQHFAITGIFLELSQNIPWIINRIFLRVVTFIFDSQQTILSLWLITATILQRLLFTTNINTTTTQASFIHTSFPGQSPCARHCVKN